jgi:hypothetical protein
MVILGGCTAIASLSDTTATTNICHQWLRVHVRTKDGNQHNRAGTIT